MSNEHGGAKSAIVGLITAGLLSNVPPEWLAFGEKLFLGTVLALVSGFAYKMGEWAWGHLQARWRK